MCIRDRSLGKSKDSGFGWRDEPVLEGRKKSGIPREDFLIRTEDFLREAIGKWLNGSEPFTCLLYTSRCV